MRTVVLRVVALAVLLLLVLVTVLTIQTLRRLPDTLVYFVTDEGNHFELRGVGRRSLAHDPEAQARASLEELIAGPTEEERAQGLTSVVPADTRINGVSFDDGIVTVDLSGEFEAGGGSSSMLGRLNQLFYTLTQPSGIEGVVLLLDGTRVRVFSGEGVLVESPWLRSEHQGLPVW